MSVFKLGQKRKMKAISVSVACNNTDTDWNYSPTDVYQLDPGWVMDAPGWEWQETSKYGKVSGPHVSYVQPNSYFTSA